MRGIEGGRALRGNEMVEKWVQEREGKEEQKSKRKKAQKKSKRENFILSVIEDDVGGRVQQECKRTHTYSL